LRPGVVFKKTSSKEFYGFEALFCDDSGNPKICPGASLVWTFKLAIFAILPAHGAIKVIAEGSWKLVQP
jgi:hypothetical protein